MRSNVYATLHGDSGIRSMGGRKNCDDISAFVNTDNASKSDCGITVHAEVSGEKRYGGKPRKTCQCCGYKWQGGWDEKTQKWIDHPDELLKNCPRCGTKRQGIDTRKSHFTITLPDQTDENCQIEITTRNHELKRILTIGAAMVTVQGVMQQHEGLEKKNPELVKSGKLRIKQAIQLLEEHEAETEKSVPNVILPGGVTLAHALSCVALVDKITTGNSHSDS
jgi:hypothetical protein